MFTGSNFKACLGRAYFGCEPLDHQLDHGDSDPRFGRFGQGVEVLTQSARAVEPNEGAFDDPAPLQDPKSLALPRPFHDRKGALQNSGYPINQLAGVTPVAQTSFSPGKQEINLVSTCLAPLRSWIPAEWTITIRSRLASTAIDAESPRSGIPGRRINGISRLLAAGPQKFPKNHVRPKCAVRRRTAEIPRRPAKSSFERSAAVRTDAAKTSSSKNA